MGPKRKATGSFDDLSKSKQLSLKDKENQPADPNLAEPSVARSSRSRSIPSTSAVQESDNTVSTMPSASQKPPRTPERPSRPMLSHSHSSHSSHSSSVKVRGHKVDVKAKFPGFAGTNVCSVDKSLLCKGFWRSIGMVGKVCLPRRSGKTYNLNLMHLFFSILPEATKLDGIPDSALESREINAEQVARMSLAAKCRAKREQLFSDSLLKSNHPDFYREHFMKYPVISISFARCKGGTLSEFIADLGECIFKASAAWLQEYETTSSNTSQFCRRTMDNLRAAIVIFKAISRDADSLVANGKSAVIKLFTSLSKYVCSRFSRYILFVDEYDILFVTIDLADWDTSTKEAMRTYVKKLYTIMFKDNEELRKGLLVGVFDYQMADISSGANNIETVCTIPRVKGKVVPSGCSKEYPDSLQGIDALADLFWFNTNEISLILDQNEKRYPSIREHRSLIMDTIRAWYNGYCIGRFSGKYNPWSTMSFISRLFQKLGKSSNQHTVEEMREIVQAAASSYWVETGTVRPIEAHIDKNRLAFADLTRRLITEYDHFNADDQSIPAVQPEYVHIYDADPSLLGELGGRYSEPALLTLCLYSGYLTRREGVNLCIPNHEVYLVWRKLLVRAVMGNRISGDNILCGRGVLLQDLFGGRTDLLATLIRQTHGVLSNHGNYLERDYANFVACALMVATLTGLLTHPSQNSIDPSHAVVYREAQAGNGRCDYALRLFGTDNQPNHFGVIIEFKFIPNGRTDDPECCEQLAATALDQISNRRYPMLLTRYLERMDIGMAVGFNTVYTKCRSFTRPTDDGNWTEVDNLINKTPIEQSN